MRWGKNIALSVLAIASLAVAFTASAANICSGISLQKNIKLPPYKIISQKPVVGNSLCQSVVSVQTLRGKQTAIFYSTKKFTLVGLLFRNGRNLTQVARQRSGNSQFSSTWSQYKGQLAGVVATTYTPKNFKKGNVYYEIADPNCPFCERMKPYIKKFSDKYGYEAKIIFFSFERPSSPKKTSNFICNKLTFMDWITNKIGTETCKKGNEYVKKANKMARNLGVNGTPTFIFLRTGTKVVGANPTALENAMKEGK